ncbi:MAG: hypothetical protein HWD61_14520 [Parachlamydiaceae bacterium]|nr:MAG: hypothetical protein HWD61_14520 [Parachlamydiaceae bacterium]
MQAAAAQEDLMTQSQIELEHYKQIGGQLEGTIKELLNHKDSQQIALREKQEEIQSLMIEMKQAEEKFNQQLQEFMALLEAEKYKNFEFERELENRNILTENNHQTLQDITEELERLKNEIALKDQSLLVQK